MLDDMRTTRRWLAGAASLSFVALALVVGLMLAGDDDGAPATTAAPAAGTDRAASGSEALPAGTQETPTTDGVVAPPGRSEQERDLPAAAEEPNVNPDHYGAAGEPQPEPSLPAAEGVREETATAPNRNPDH
jgi:hypothetical protein